METNLQGKGVKELINTWLNLHNTIKNVENNNRMIYAFFSSHETRLSILTTISYNFQFVKTHIM